MRNQAPKREHGAFTSGAARQALAALRKNRSGALLVTSGHRDVRLVLEARRVSVEVAGVDLDGAESDAWEISRQFLGCLFWGDSTYFLDLDGKPMSDALALRAEAVLDKAIGLLDEGFQELTSLREQVPGVDVLVSAKGAPPPADVNSCAANLFRALGPNPRHLGSAAKEAGLDPLDAAWGVSDLLEGEQAQVKRAPPTMAVRRLKSAEPLIREGLSPGVRALHLARGYARSEPRRSARFLQEAGLAFLAAGQGEQALEVFKQSLELAPKDLGGLEGMVQALESVGQRDEARRIREDLIDLYQSWNLPSRTLEHLDRLAPLSLEQELTKLDCLLIREDFAGASDQARKVFPKVPAGQRVALARRFAQAGAPAAAQAEAVQLSGARRLLWPRRVLVGANLLLLLGLAVVGAETYLRYEFKRASAHTKVALRELEPVQPGAAPLTSGVSLVEPWNQLLEVQRRAAPLALGQRLPQSALGHLDGVLAELNAIQDDARLLQEPKVRGALDWRASSSVLIATDALKALAAAARSESLKRRVELDQADLAEYLERIAAKIKTFESKTQLETRLQLGQALLREHANAQARFTNLWVELEVEVTPAERTQAHWALDGGSPAPLAGSATPGKFRPRLPLRPGASGTLRLSCPDYVPRQLTFKVDTLREPVVPVDLVRCVPVGARSERPVVSERSGVVVLDGPIQITGIEPPDIESSAPDLAPLVADLHDTELLVVRLLVRTRPASRVGGAMPLIYLSSIEVWLSVPATGKKGRGYLIDLEGAVVPGIRRIVERRSGTWVLSRIGKLERAAEILDAIRYAITKEREALQE